MTSSPDEHPDVTDVTDGELQETAAPQPVEEPGAPTAEKPAPAPQPGRRPGGPPEAHPDESGNFPDEQGEVEGDVVDDADLAASDELILAQTALAERTLDLQRIQAEFVNYKRRVERDRDLVKQNATFGVLGSLLPILDDIDRAREHGELEGGFKAVAESLERTVAALGLTKFGAQGDEFDPERPRGADARSLTGRHDHDRRRGGPRGLSHR